MPEGPSILILKEEVQQFKGKKVLEVGGNRKLDLQRMKNLKVTDFKTWGKHFIICFPKFSVKIHLLLFGTYRINERKESEPRLSLRFSNGELNFYACSVQFIEGDINDAYDWSGDVLSDEWNAKAAMKKLKAKPDTLACDALLDQDIFAGVGNIIKNEVLYRIEVHPASRIGALPAAKLKQLIAEARNYSFDFLEWKKQYVLKQHWLAHRKSTCVRCGLPYSIQHLGKTNRRAYYCTNCQEKYE